MTKKKNPNVTILEDSVSRAGRKVFQNAKKRREVNPPPSQSTTDKIERLEKSSSQFGDRLGLIRMH